MSLTQLATAALRELLADTPDPYLAAAWLSDLSPDDLSTVATALLELAGLAETQRSRLVTA